MRKVNPLRTILSTALLLSMILVLLPASASTASTSTWDFTNPADYTYDPLLAQVSSGTAHSNKLDLDSGWWTKTYDGGIGDDEGYAVSCDGSGNPVVAGYVTVAGGNLDIWVRKYSGSDGSTLWEKTYHHASGSAYASGVSCDPNGNPVVAGTIWNGSNCDIWVRKYSGTDGATMWGDVYGTGRDDIVTAISCDPNGNPVVAGYVDTGGNTDFWVRKYNGANGAVLWTQTHSVASIDYGRGVSCDGDGNAVVTGSTWPGATYDIWTGKFRSDDGVLLWDKLYDSGFGDESFGVSCDGSGDPVVAGSVGSATGNTDIWARKYSGTNGDVLWTQTFDYGDWDQGSAVSCDRNGDPVVVGKGYGTSGYDIWVGKCARKTDGALLWSRTWHSDDGDSWADGVSCDSAGNPTVAGSYDAGSTYDVWVRKYPPGDYPLSPDIQTKNPVDLNGANLTGFSEKTGSGNAGNISYQLSPDGSTFYYYNGVSWVNAGGDPSKSNSASEVDNNIADFNGIATSKLFVKAFLNSPDGMQYASLDEVSVEKSEPPQTITTWYLAEGTNAWGFSTYITLENPNDTAVSAKLTYMDPNAPAAGKGVLKTRTTTLPPLSQTTVSSMSDIGVVDFSTKVECTEGKTIAVDRTMFWTGADPSLRGYHSSIASEVLSRNWYLPEGSTNWGFETWTCVFNPNATSANITLTYMTDSGPRPFKKVIPANSRATWPMASDVGAADASIEVTSDQCVMAERSVYRNNRREGSCSLGAATPASDFYLAEGAAGYTAGFTTWVLVQNPGIEDNHVTLTYNTHSGAVPGPTFAMAPGSRKTVRVNDTIPPNTDVSTTVHGTKPLVAERAMYWDAGLGECFHASIGLPDAHMTFMLPDGQVGGGAQTYTLVYNPNPGAVTVRITYLPQDGGNPVAFTAEIPKGSRSTYNMADKLPSGRASILVESLDGARPIMVERAMYGDDWGSGTDTIGAFSD